MNLSSAFEKIKFTYPFHFKMYSNSNAYLQNGEDVNLKNDLLIFISHQNLLSLNTNLILNEIQQIFEEMLLAILMCKLN